MKVKAFFPQAITVPSSSMIIVSLMYLVVCHASTYFCQVTDSREAGGDGEGEAGRDREGEAG